MATATKIDPSAAPATPATATPPVEPAAPTAAAPAVPAVKQRPVTQIVNELAAVKAQLYATLKVCHEDAADLREARKVWDEERATIAGMEAVGEKSWLASLLKREHKGPRPDAPADAAARAVALHTLHYVHKDLEDELSQYTRSEQNRAVRAGVLAAAKMQLRTDVSELPPPEEVLSADERRAKRQRLLADAGIVPTTPAAV